MCRGARLRLGGIGQDRVRGSVERAAIKGEWRQQQKESIHPGVEPGTS